MNILILEDSLPFLERMRKLLLGDFFTTANVRMTSQQINAACLCPGIAFTRHEKDNVLLVSTNNAAMRAMKDTAFDFAFFDKDVCHDNSTPLLAHFLQQEQQPSVCLISDEVDNQLSQLQKIIGEEQVRGLQDKGRLMTAEKTPALILHHINRICLTPARPKADIQADEPGLD